MDPTPWFDDPNRFGALFGAIVGGGGGTLAGILGALTGWLAPKGRAKPLILSGYVFFIAVGVILLFVGLWALVAQQPYGIWYPFLLCGIIFTTVCSGLLPTVLKRYDEAERSSSSI